MRQMLSAATTLEVPLVTWKAFFIGMRIQIKIVSTITGVRIIRYGTIFGTGP
jgi:hypothetical protein